MSRPAAAPAAAGQDQAGRSGGRLLGYAVLSCAAGAGIALFALSRVWSVQVTARPGLSDLRAATTGGAQLPWLPAVALVALAGAGALLATRGVIRRSVGVLLALAGAALATGVLVGRARLDPGAAGAGATLWPAAGVVGATLVGLGAWWTIRYGHRWPAMGAKYDRPTTSAGVEPDEVVRPGRIGNPVPVDQAPVDTRVAWDALDRGEDPTAN